MKIARILAPVYSLGPGSRVCLWVQGCSKHCPGCISPEMQPSIGKEISEEALGSLLIRLQAAEHCSGITISGGDPFEQPDALLALLKTIRPSFQDILVYTGETIDHIQEGRDCLSYIDVLIDGRYEHQKNTSDCTLRGSSNQIIHYLTPGLRDKYQAYILQGRTLQTFSHNGSVLVIGIMDKE